MKITKDLDELEAEELLTLLKSIVETLATKPKSSIPSPSEFEARMRSISEGSTDAEATHVAADEYMMFTLSQLGYEKGVKIFDSMEKNYA